MDTERGSDSDQQDSTLEEVPCVDRRVELYRHVTTTASELHWLAL